MLTPETLINDRYRIVGLVGQGGMGAVRLRAGGVYFVWGARECPAACGGR